MKHFVLILIALLSMNNSYSQENSTEHLYEKVNKYVTELKSKGIDTICIYQDYYVGIQRKNYAEEPCNYENTFIPTYIFWKQNNITYVTRKDNCFDFDILKIEQNNFWNLIFENKKIILNEKNLGFEFIENKSHRKLYKSESHSHYRRFEIFINKYTCEKYFGDFDLTEYNSGDLNINYKYNNSTKSKLLMDELEKIVNELISKKRFKKT